MTDERFLAAFDAFGAPVEPAPAFADRLFESLVADLGLRERAGRRTLGGRVRRALGIETLPTGQAAMRLAWLAAAVGLLLALLGGALFVASQLLARPSPRELVELSQAAYLDPPAFSITYRGPGAARLSSDGNGTWRVDSNANEPAGAYSLWDGTRVGVYEPTRRTWSSGTPTEVGTSPSLPLWGELAWGDGQWLNDDPRIRYIPCDGAEALPGMTIIGHETDHIVCTDIDMEYWLDRETHLVLRMEPGPNTPHWNGTGLASNVIEATAFELGPRPAAEFAWSGPPGAYAPDEVPASLVLADGAPLPPWSGTTATGEPFETADVGLPAVYLFAATWCPPCDAEYDAVVAGLRERPSLAGVIVNSDPAGTAAGYAAAHGVTVPVIADPDDVFAKSWGLTAYPTLLTLDATGRVSSIVTGGLRPADVDRVLDAVAAGDPVPSVSPAPDEELWPEEPSPSFTVEGTPRPRILEPMEATDPSRVTGIPFGAVVPSFSGPRMGGGTFDSSELRGRPAIIGLWLLGAWADTNLDNFAKAMEQVGDDVAVVMVVTQEDTPGATAAMFAEHGYTIPVVFDWEGRIALALNQQTNGTLVLDAQGRLVDERVEGPDRQPSLEELRQIATQLAP